MTVPARPYANLKGKVLREGQAKAPAHNSNLINPSLLRFW